jgi:hypothetical protein
MRKIKIQEGTVPQRRILRILLVLPLVAFPSRTPLRIAIVLYYLFWHYRNCAPSPLLEDLTSKNSDEFFSSSWF